MPEVRPYVVSPCERWCSMSSELMTLIDRYASKRALHSFLEASRVACERKTTGPKRAEQAAVNDADDLRRQIVAALAAPVLAALPDSPPLALREVLAEMVKMMDDGNEAGAGNDWHVRAIAALAAAAPVEAAPVLASAPFVPDAWISEVCGPEVNDLSYGQGFRDGFNRCREQVLAAVPAAAPEPACAARDVLAERARQIEKKGHTPYADDCYSGSDLARAAACYAYPELVAVAGLEAWPWYDLSGWKPSDPRRNCVKAAALLLAEIERIDRAAAPTEGSHE